MFSLSREKKLTKIKFEKDATNNKIRNINSTGINLLIRVQSLENKDINYLEKVGENSPGKKLKGILCC